MFAKRQSYLIFRNVTKKRTGFWRVGFFFYFCVPAPTDSRIIGSDTGGIDVWSLSGAIYPLTVPALDNDRTKEHDGS